jgi:hypothetical protein
LRDGARLFIQDLCKAQASFSRLLQWPSQSVSTMVNGPGAGIDLAPRQPRRKAASSTNTGPRRATGPTPSARRHRSDRGSGRFFLCSVTRQVPDERRHEMTRVCSPSLMISMPACS